MFIAMRARLATHLKAAHDSLKMLCRQPVASVMTIISIASILTLPAVLLMLTGNIESLMSKWQKDEYISLYLTPALAVSSETQTLTQVRAIPAVKQAILKSSTEGLAELSQQEGMQDIMQDLSDNPLPAVIEVTPSLEVKDDASRHVLYAQLKALPFVEQVKVDSQWIKRLDAIMFFLTVVARALMGLLALAVVFIISNTLRQTVYNRHEEIQVLKLVGAKDSYILRPFLYSGVFYGFLSALCSGVLIYLFTSKISEAVNQLTLAFEAHYVLLSLSFYQTLSFVLLAMILGWIGACLSVKRQLASIEPYD